MTVLSIDVGGTSIKHAIINEGAIVAKGVTPTPTTKKEFLEAINSITNKYDETYDFKDITLSFPGYINPNNGYAEKAGALNFLDGSNIIDQFAETIGQDYVYHIENDANCAAIAEKNSGRAVDNQSFLLVTVGTGFGGAFYINNQLVRGFQYKAGEFGQMRIMSRTDIDRKVNSLASVKWLIMNYKELKNLPKEARVSGEEILDNSKDDPDTGALVKSWIADICVSIFNVVTVINPEKILIGGGISSHPSFLPLVRETMDILLNDWHEFRVPIETCKYHNDAGLLGAYYNVISN
ncbi:ROK family protein [Alkalibacterium sp. 20]|uniref:ROK family protein n=1 Tax=Alkalibacterium sp. 20 TaxID=1798803 RepID=UPI0008FFEDF7|nr:ROK family protein [Alkalibacterium sp. 20]OJF94679.1 hypothetical protein AX762_07300 [Alkalibacterium sp. 20]